MSATRTLEHRRGTIESSLSVEPSQRNSALQETFLHVAGVGKITEERLKNRGMLRWEDVIRSYGELRTLPGLPQPSDNNGRSSSQSRLVNELLDSQKAVERCDAGYFSDRLPAREWWRLYDEFRENALFLDIETTGLSKRYHQLTMVGYYSVADGYSAHMQGDDPAELSEALSNASLVVTFNGSTFDLPFLQAKIKGLQLPQIHLDLRYLLKRIGFSGGLKSIETELEIHRPEGGATDGREAVALWYRRLRGDRDALERLIEYNYDDTVIMKELADFAVAVMKNGDAGTMGPLDDLQTKSVRRPDLSELIERAFAVAPTARKWSVDDIWPPKRRSKRGKIVKIVGLDITSAAIRPSGWALVEGVQTRTLRLRTDEEIISTTVEAEPDLVSIDSPLSLPPGTMLGDDGQVESYERIYRDSELELKRRGISVYWCLLPSMKELSLRGMRLARGLRAEGLKVIESYPGAAQDMLAIPRKGVGVDDLAKGLIEFGIKGSFEKEPISHDELDAITSAIVGMFYLTGRYEALGPSDENDLIMPLLS